MVDLTPFSTSEMDTTLQQGDADQRTRSIYNPPFQQEDGGAVLEGLIVHSLASLHVLFQNPRAARNKPVIHNRCACGVGDRVSAQSEQLLWLEQS